MRIAIDLEGTLCAQCGEFRCEPMPSLARQLSRRSLRQGARLLLRDLARAGHRLTVYSSGEHSAARLWLWCLLAGLPIHGVRTVKQEQKRALKQTQKNQKRFAKELKALGLTQLGKPQPLLWPPCQNQDLVLDDDPRHLQTAWRSGVKSILVTNIEADWTARIREATLSEHGFEIIAMAQAA